jgi:quercetin dioxygenase-like cupin family protein
MPFFSTRNVPFRQKRAGVQMKAFSGSQIQMTIVQLEPGFISSHTHPEEQMGYILSGEMEMSIGEEKMNCAHGDGYSIPGGMLHSVRVTSDQPVELLEIFSPPKEENRI